MHIEDLEEERAPLIVVMDENKVCVDPFVPL